MVILVIVLPSEVARADTFTCYFRYISNAAPDLQAFSQAKAAGKEVFKVIKRRPAISYESEGIILDKVTGNIELREVDFTYPSRDNNPILQGFSLTIPAGKVVALVGSSGCGKSTVISLVQRFYDPISGMLQGQIHIFYGLKR
jgi:ATP-binding cassette subfamily B (MDR/TAP) protein 1